MAHATAQQLPPPRLHFQVQRSATGDHVVVSAYDILGRDVGHIQAGELGLRGAQTRWDIAGGQGQARGFVACARQVEDLRARGYEPTEAWAVFSAMLQSEFHGRGLGVQLYDALLKAIAARAKGTVFIGPEACWTGTTSDAAGRVWDSLARRYPSSGRILVLEPRAGNPPRRGAKRDASTITLIRDVAGPPGEPPTLISIHTADHVAGLSAQQWHGPLSSACAEALARAGGLVPFVVEESSIQSKALRNIGLGVELYVAAAEEAAKVGGALVASACVPTYDRPVPEERGYTSKSAMRVWKSRRFAERVNVDGLVAWVSPVRVTNPSQVEHERRARELVRDGDASYLAALQARTNESTLEHLLASISAYTAALQELSWVHLGGIRKTRQMVQIRLDNAQANLIAGWTTQPVPRRLAKRMRQYLLDGRIPEKPETLQLQDFPVPTPKLRLIRGGRENPRALSAARNPSAPMTKREYKDLLESLSRDFRSARPMLSALPLLGAGTQRSTYRLDVDGYEPTALKVCDDHACGQMQVEIQCMRETESPLVPALYDYGPPEDPRWAEIELLSPMTTSDFERATGLPWERAASAPWYASPWTFDHALETVICDGRGEFGAKQRRMFAELAMRGSARPAATRKFIQQLMDVVRSCRLDPEELLVLHNWGVNAKGQIKIADLGYPSGVQFNPAARLRSPLALVVDGRVGPHLQLRLALFDARHEDPDRAIVGILDAYGSPPNLHVENAAAKRKYGPVLYEVAMAWAADHGAWLSPSRLETSAEARRVWERFQTRSDISCQSSDLGELQCRAPWPPGASAAIARGEQYVAKLATRHDQDAASLREHLVVGVSGQFWSRMFARDNPGQPQQLAYAFRRIAAHPWVTEHCARTGCRSLTEGGCLAFARALQQWLGGGELVALLAGPVPFHVAVEHDGVIYDVEGPTDRADLLRRWTPRVRRWAGNAEVTMAPWEQVQRHASIMPWPGLQRSVLELLEAELGPASAAHDNPSKSRRSRTKRPRSRRSQAAPATVSIVRAATPREVAIAKSFESVNSEDDFDIYAWYVGWVDTRQFLAARLHTGDTNIRSTAAWQAWWNNEVSDPDERGLDELFEEWDDGAFWERGHDPIIVTFKGDSHNIEDGWHRTAIAVLRGVPRISALIGIQRPTHDNPANRDLRTEVLRW